MNTGGAELRQMGYWKLVRSNADFRFLWFGQIVSLFGDWFNLIASAALVASLTHSGIAVGTLFIIRMLAPFIISPVAGVVADRYDRRKILMVQSGHVESGDQLFHKILSAMAAVNE